MNASRRRVLAAALAGSAVALATGCAAGGQTDSPATIDSNTPSDNGAVVAVPSRGTAASGDITVSGASYLRLAGTQLQVNMRIANAGSTPDRLVGATSNVGQRVVLTPSTIAVPAGGSVTLLTRPPMMVITPYEKLAPRETIEITLDFGSAGTVQVYLGEVTGSNS